MVRRDPFDNPDNPNSALDFPNMPCSLLRDGFFASSPFAAMPVTGSHAPVRIREQEDGFPANPREGERAKTLSSQNPKKVPWPIRRAHSRFLCGGHRSVRSDFLRSHVGTRIQRQTEWVGVPATGMCKPPKDGTPTDGVITSPIYRACTPGARTDYLRRRESHGQATLASPQTTKSGCAKGRDERLLVLSSKKPCVRPCAPVRQTSRLRFSLCALYCGHA
jgi:hypothetical protein